MKPVFKNISLANQANEYVANHLQDEGQKTNPKYRCDKFCNVVELPDGRAFMECDHPLLKDCGVPFELGQVTATLGEIALVKAKALVDQILADQESNAINDPVQYSLEKAEEMKKIADQVL